MSYVIVPAFARDELLAQAEQRWDGIRQARPDLEPAIDLQRRLLTLVIDLATAFEHARLPRLSLPPKYLAAKLARGVPVLSGEPIPLPMDDLRSPLLSLCQELAAGGAGDAAEHIHSSLARGSLDAGSLLSASLARDETAIRTGAVHRGLAPDLVWLVAELAVGPFVHALQHLLLASLRDEPLTSAVNVWTHGYCLACGSWPAMAEFVDGRRVLRCSFCALAWVAPARGCTYCGEGGNAFVVAAPDLERKDRRVEICGSCKGYLKTLDLVALTPFPLLAIGDMETMDMDLAAMERGYMRPTLKHFAK